MKACAVTDTGRVRPVNQDFLYASTEPVGPLANLFIVADGMGGHQAGDFASRYLVGHLVKHIESSSLAAEQPVPVLRQAIEDVNTELFGGQPPLYDPGNRHTPDHKGSLLCGGDGVQRTDGAGQQGL